MTNEIFDIILLNALPASGKSEILRWLSGLSPAEADELHLGKQIHLDDYPFVQFMREVDTWLVREGMPTLFYQDLDSQFRDPLQWLVCSRLLNVLLLELHVGSAKRREEAIRQGRCAAEVMDRFTAAFIGVGLKPPFAGFKESVRMRLEASLEEFSRKICQDEVALWPQDGNLADKTFVVEFARGGPEGSSMPVPFPYGYRNALSQFSPEVLQRSVILYIQVTPEESRRKNDARAIHNLEGQRSSLNHGVPEVVMRGDYGCDDMAYLVGLNGNSGSISILGIGGSGPFELPTFIFDNREDLTSHLRGPREEWDPVKLAKLEAMMRDGFARLFEE